MPTDPRHILVIHVAGLTHTTLALPALRALRSHLPNARITIASSTTAADLLRLASCANEVLPVGRLHGAELLWPSALYRSGKSLSEVKRSFYDLAIELRKGAEARIVLQLAHPLHKLNGQHNLGAVLERVTQALAKRATPKHAAYEYLKRLEPLGVRPLEAEPRLTTDRAADERIEKLLCKHGANFGSLLIGIHPGAGPGKQRWPLERFASIAARMIHNFNARPLIFAGPHERDAAKRLLKMLPAKSAIALESPTIPDFVSALARASLFIANHSGPAHVAAAAGAPVVVASPFPAPTEQDLLGPHHTHVRAPHPELISEDEVYAAACQLLKMNRAEFLRTR